MKKTILIFLILIFSFIILNPSPQILEEKIQHSEELKPSPKNIKESTALYVYIFWMWLIIFVLIYILILKIKEADKIHRMRLEESEKKIKEN
jgi:Na+/H+ antiporter NhaC